MYNPAIKNGHMDFLIESNHSDDKRKDITEWVRERILHNKARNEYVKEAFYVAEQELLAGYIDFLDKENLINLWKAINHKDFDSQFKKSENYKLFKIEECKVIVNATLESNLELKKMSTEEDIQSIRNKVFDLLCEAFKTSREIDEVKYQELKVEHNTEKAVDILAHNINDLENATQLAGEIGSGDV